MATYHFTMKTGGKGAAAAHARYIAREGQYRERADLEYAEHGYMPEWAGDPIEFWKAADEFERENGTAYREIEIALPRELDEVQRRELVLYFVDEHLGDAHPYTLAIHNPKAAIERGEQPHAHIQFCERKLDGIERGWGQFFKRANRQEPEKGGCAKDERWNGKDRADHLEKLRLSWEQYVNRSYELAGRPERVSCKSLEDQGIDRAPERHLGPKMVRNKESVDLMKELREYQRELALIEWDRAAITAELEQVKSEGMSLSASPTAKVNSQPLSSGSSLQRPAFSSYDEAVKFEATYSNARREVIEEFYRQPLQRQYELNRLELSRIGKELERATTERETTEKSLFKFGVAKKKEIEKQAKQAWSMALRRDRKMEEQLQQIYPQEWARENAQFMERELQKRLGPDCQNRWDQARQITNQHRKEAQQKQLDRIAQERSVAIGKDMNGRDLCR